MANSAEIDRQLLSQLIGLLEPQDDRTRLRMLNTAAMWFNIAADVMFVDSGAVGVRRGKPRFRLKRRPKHRETKR